MKLKELPFDKTGESAGQLRPKLKCIGSLARLSLGKFNNLEPVRLLEALQGVALGFKAEA